MWRKLNAILVIHRFPKAWSIPKESQPGCNPYFEILERFLAILTDFKRFLGILMEAFGISLDF